MNQKVKNSIVWSMLVVLLISTLGMSVNTLYCFCKGELEYSLFDIKAQNHCEKANDLTDLPSCCEKISNQKSCCKSEESCSDEKHHTKPCTKKGAVFVKLNVDFLIPNTDLEDVSFPSFDGLVFDFHPIIFTSECPIICIPNTKKAKLNKAPPETIFGKQICIFHQSFLC